MKKQTKNTLVLLMVVVLTYVFIWIYPNRDGGIEIKTVAPLGRKVVSILLKSEKSGEVLLNKIEKKWYVSEKKHLADSTKVEKVLEVFSEDMELEPVSFSGTSEAFSRYNLDKNSRSEVYLMGENGKELRKVYVGKSANRYLSRYVVLGDEKNIYATQIGDVLNDFSPVFFRDKTIISFLPEKIDWIGAKQQKKSQTAILKLFLKEAKLKKEQKSEENQTLSLQNQQYVDEKGTLYDYKKVYALVNKIATLKALDFFEVKERPDLVRSRLITYRFRSEDKEKEVILYKKAEKGYPVRISSGEQGYFISFQDGDALRKGFMAYRLK